MNEQQNQVVSQQRLALVQRQAEMASIDARIAQLQGRLQRKRELNQRLSQQLGSNTRMNSNHTNFSDSKLEFNTSKSRPTGNIAAIEPYSHIPNDDFSLNKNDPKYQTLPYNTKFTVNFKTEDDLNKNKIQHSASASQISQRPFQQFGHQIAHSQSQSHIQGQSQLLVSTTINPPPTALIFAQATNNNTNNNNNKYTGNSGYTTTAAAATTIPIPLTNENCANNHSDNGHHHHHHHHHHHLHQQHHRRRRRRNNNTKNNSNNNVNANDDDDHDDDDDDEDEDDEDEDDEEDEDDDEDNDDNDDVVKPEMDKGGDNDDDAERVRDGYPDDEKLTNTTATSAATANTNPTKNNNNKNMINNNHNHNNNNNNHNKNKNNQSNNNNNSGVTGHGIGETQNLRAHGHLFSSTSHKQHAGGTSSGTNLPCSVGISIAQSQIHRNLSSGQKPVSSVAPSFPVKSPIYQTSSTKIHPVMPQTLSLIGHGQSPAVQAYNTSSQGSIVPEQYTYCSSQRHNFSAGNQLPIAQGGGIGGNTGGLHNNQSQNTNTTIPTTGSSPAQSSAYIQTSHMGHAFAHSQTQNNCQQSQLLCNNNSSPDPHIDKMTKFDTVGKIADQIMVNYDNSQPNKFYEQPSRHDQTHGKYDHAQLIHDQQIKFDHSSKYNDHSQLIAKYEQIQLQQIKHEQNQSLFDNAGQVLPQNSKYDLNSMKYDHTTKIDPPLTKLPEKPFEYDRAKYDQNFDSRGEDKTKPALPPKPNKPNPPPRLIHHEKIQVNSEVLDGKAPVIVGVRYEYYCNHNIAFVNHRIT